MENIKEVSAEELLKENESLKEENMLLRLAVSNMIEENGRLGEFIRVKLESILGLAKDFRDSYCTYANFVERATENYRKGVTGESTEQSGADE